MVRMLRLLAILVIIPVAFLIGAPALALDGNTAEYQIQGIELFPGIDMRGNNYGAAFVAQASGVFPTETSGILNTSVNYEGTSPIPYGTNDFIGGTWTLKVMRSGRLTGTIIGVVNSTGGYISWQDNDPNTPPNTGTEIGTAYIPLTIIGGTGEYRGIRGSGLFEGYDNHLTTIPTIGGTLTLTFSSSPPL